MKFKMLLPRELEATLIPSLKGDLIIQPKIYRKTGWVPVFYCTSTNNKGIEQLYVLSASSKGSMLRLEKLKEIIPSETDDDDEEELEDEEEHKDIEGAQDVAN